MSGARHLPFDDSPSGTGRIPVPEASVIDAFTIGPVLTCLGTEEDTFIIENMVLMHGESAFGAAVSGEGSSITLVRNLVTSNTTFTGGTIEDTRGLIPATTSRRTRREKAAACGKYTAWLQVTQFTGIPQDPGEASSGHSGP
jgi:hypothetical protein